MTSVSHTDTKPLSPGFKPLLFRPVHPLTTIPHVTGCEFTRTGPSVSITWLLATAVSSRPSSHHHPHVTGCELTRTGPSYNLRALAPGRWSILTTIHTSTPLCVPFVGIPIGRAASFAGTWRGCALPGHTECFKRPHWPLRRIHSLIPKHIHDTGASRERRLCIRGVRVLRLLG
jgi:hypothetical protein